MPGLEDELGDVVRKARAGLGMEVGAVAQQVGLTERDLKGLEVYTFRPDETQVRRLARVLQLREDQLWELAQESWSAPEVPWQIGDAYTIDRLTNDFPEHCYVVTGRDGTCVIVDPGAEPERVVQTATQHGRRPVAILITHAHHDHTGAVVPVQRATGARVHVHRADVSGVDGVPAAAVETFDDDGVLSIAGFDVRTLHTPGHTPGSATFVIEGAGRRAAFCGDTLFAGSAGNSRAGYQVLLSSLRDKLAKLPPETPLYPGHGPATTVANELERNPFL
jgi:hydroxyacylglutathione hydrolase